MAGVSGVAGVSVGAVGFGVSGVFGPGTEVVGRSGWVSAAIDVVWGRY